MKLGPTCGCYDIPRRCSVVAARPSEHPGSSLMGRRRAFARPGLTWRRCRSQEKGPPKTREPVHGRRPYAVRSAGRRGEGGSPTPGRTPPQRSSALARRARMPVRRALPRMPRAVSFPLASRLDAVAMLACGLAVGHIVRLSPSRHGQHVVGLCGPARAARVPELASEVIPAQHGDPPRLVLGRRRPRPPSRPCHHRSPSRERREPDASRRALGIAVLPAPV